jgi:ABC-type amino acid transport substrate-binding protein
MKIRRSLKAWSFAAAFAAGSLAGPAALAEPLRVCADPDNLPFSKSEGPERGLYIELAELVGQKLGQPVEYTWYYTNMQRRALRNTVGAHVCDVVMALPTDYKARGLQKTQPYLKVGYALVAAPTFTFKGLDDLRSRRIGVQFGTTPHIVLNTLEGFRSTTYRSPDEVFDALAKGEIDAGFLWGPVAGYENKKRQGNRWRITPVAGHDLAGEVAAAVRRDKEGLAPAIDKALAELRPQIEQLADKYGFPREKPVDLAFAGAVSVPSAMLVRVADAPDAAPDPEAAKRGRIRFNDTCSHCHGTDGASPIRERDLRRLKSRYEDKWFEVAQTTVRNGRPDKGMPTWGGVLKDAEIEQVLAFLRTVQR